MKKSRIVLFFAAALLFALPSFGQATTGYPPFSSLGGGPDSINLGNLNSHITVPVLQKAGRGDPFAYSLSYDSSIWQPVASSGVTSWEVVTATTWGWTASMPKTGHLAAAIFQGYSTCYTNNRQQQQELTIRYSWTYYDGFGTPHQFPGVSTRFSGCTTGTTTLNAIAMDGSGYTISVTGFTLNSLIASNGALINPSGGAVLQDRNGNEITEDSNGNLYDTLNGTTPTLAVAGSGTPSSPYTFTYTAPSGAAATYTMKYTAYTVQTNFGCSGITEFGPTSENLVSEIDLPDISVNPADKYTFSYETTPGFSGSKTGRLVSVTLPTGGTISYSYSGGSNGIVCADGTTATLTRNTPDGQWVYAHTENGTAWTTNVTDPQSDQTVIDFQGIYETQRQISSSSTLLETVVTCYNGNTANCNTTAITLPITQRSVTTILPSGQQREHVENWNAYGAPTESDDYDYGSAPHGSLLKKVLSTYATLGSITSFRQEVTIQNGSGTTVSQSIYAYDGTTPTTTSGTPQHASVSTPRGNVTSVNVYTNSSTSFTKYYTYYDTGNLQTLTDVNNGVTTYNYASGVASCYNSFPTSITEAVTTLSTSTTWNCAGGVQLTSTDENSQTTTTSYTEPYFWRPASITDPIGAVISYCYGLLTSGTCTPNTTQTESALNFNSSTVDILTTADTLGRGHIQQTRQAPGSSNFDSTETDYDSLGRVGRITLPYTGTEGQTYSGSAATTYTYDAMNRPLTIEDGGGGITAYNYGQGNDTFVTRSPAPTWDSENTKRRQFEYDGLGRLTSVCEVTAGTTAWPGGTCAQHTNQTGYWTKYAYDPLGNLTSLTQNAQLSGSTQSRYYLYDWMSRMTSETVPEIGATGNGTASYTYDSDSTCGTYQGDLVKRVDAAGNVVCNAYDPLHRQIAITYPSGVYSSVTPQKHFVYDTAMVNSQTMLYTKARLAEAYTCVSPCTTKLTDLGVSYSVRGEKTDSYESTPNSGGFYYHVSQTYSRMPHL